MEDFKARGYKYISKLIFNGYGRDAYRLIKKFASDKDEIKRLFFFPRNDQELRLVDSILSVVIDALKMCSYEEIVAEDDDWNEKFLVEYMDQLMSECLAGESEIFKSPIISAQFLYEGARAIALGKLIEVLTKLDPVKLSKFMISIDTTFPDMAIEYNGSSEFLDYLEEVQKEFHKLFEEGYSEKRQIAEVFYNKRVKYHEKTFDGRELDAEIYLTEVLFKNDAKMRNMIYEPQNNQELRRVEAILSITMDYRSMMGHNYSMTEDEDLDSEFLEKYSKDIAAGYAEIIADKASSPKEMAQFLFEGVKSLKVPSSLTSIVFSSSHKARKNIFDIVSKVIYQIIFAKSDIKFLEEVAKEFHELYQKEYEEKGYQYKYGNSKGKK